MFTAAKDALSSRAAQTWANTLLSRYGKVEDLKIDSRRRTLEVCCRLEGEVAPITIKVGRYVIEEEGPKRFLRASEFSCTRPWLQSLLTDHATGRRVELPSWAAAAL